MYMEDTITHRQVQSNGITMHIAEAGQGPLVILLHGFPELAYSWRHQLPALAAAGYHAVAVDMRGYGGSSAPDAVEAYDIVNPTDGLTGLRPAPADARAGFAGGDSAPALVARLGLLF